jgi:lipopolysaccharide export system permease protein
MATRSANLLNRYLLGLLIRPLLLSIGVVLLALLLERLLRLFDLVAATDNALDSVLLMLLYLVPHYLGLALPAAFFASIFMVVARLGDDNELDALLASGRSISQTAQPFFAVALVLSLFSFYLYGSLQPYSRYRYHQVSYDAEHAGWNARAQENIFSDAGGGFVLTADQVDATGRGLTRVFIRRLGSQGEEEITTAQSGRLQPSADGKTLLLHLEDGQLVHEDPDRQLLKVMFKQGTFNEDFNPDAPPFRARGESERELTSLELWRGLHQPTPPLSAPQLAGELQARWVRALSFPLLPLLAVPLGMSAKRGRRAPGVIVACLALLALQHGVQFGESLAEAGRAPVIAAVWTPLLVFGGISAWLFFGSLKTPGDNPVTRAVSAIEAMLDGIHLRRPKKSAPHSVTPRSRT